MRRILITGDGYKQAHMQRLEAGGFSVLHQPAIDHRELLALLPAVDGYILGGDERLDADNLRLATNLKVISFVGTGFQAFIDPQAAASLGIVVTNTPGGGTAAVTEHTVGLMIAMARRLFAQNEFVKRGGANWEGGQELCGTKIGIVGMGAIAERLSRLLRRGFDCQVGYANRTRKQTVEQELGIEYLALPDLFHRSEIVVLLVAYSPETANFVNQRLLEESHEGLILVNTASAHLVDPHALHAAMLSGKVASAAFDGYWIEPLPKPADDPFGFLTMPDGRFSVTPHTAAKTVGTWNRIIDAAVDNLITAFEKEAQS